MGDMTERDAVRAEFYVRHHHGFRTLAAARAAVRDAMADEIVQQRHRADRAERILAALREPSDAVLDAAYEAYDAITYAGPLNGGSLCPSIRAAVAAAEQEVGRE